MLHLMFGLYPSACQANLVLKAKTDALCTSSQNSEGSEMMIVAGFNNISDNLNLLAYPRKFSATAQQ
jgi:hypothetical protein